MNNVPLQRNVKADLIMTLNGANFDVRCDQIRYASPLVVFLVVVFLTVVLGTVIFTVVNVVVVAVAVVVGDDVVVGVVVGMVVGRTVVVLERRWFGRVNAVALFL